MYLVPSSGTSKARTIATGGSLLLFLFADEYACVSWSPLQHRCDVTPIAQIFRGYAKSKPVRVGGHKFEDMGWVRQPILSSKAHANTQSGVLGEEGRGGHGHTEPRVFMSA